ncbi:hypothetical protein Misp01_02460 [Microtetraspora sp. NBRC 13810]|uniref:hypothetical protein n=1 Tax=Microtetraspora sp. NBRC 13810 TaxID=3030990 RepID=UPI0024A43254|nr:hypothetical protein [Microtetraspora sp. NBRC 13810]GLW05116.1 hypothetical protein Misp01_02460 [Microtetraspora sp. NBRC 13810]
MYVDPPAPKPMQPGETPPAPSPGVALTPGAQTSTWVFNRDYEQLVRLWQEVVPALDAMAASLDKSYQMARSPDVWDAPVAERYVEDIAEWRKRLALYRQSVLTSISDQAADTPRWIPGEPAAPHAFMP